ncbi:MAG: BON domain-containing protein [Bryobacteraceae bacterium]
MANKSIRDRVNEELALEPMLEEQRLTVTADDGLAVITGVVDSYPKKLAAEHVALRVHGVTCVRSEIVVVLPEPDRRPDAELLSVVCRVLGWTAHVPLQSIDVVVVDGVVELRGEVDWRYHKEAAERAVQSLAGVCGVRNLIRIRPSRMPSRLEDAVLAAIGESALGEVEHIDVHSHEGDVVVSGVVSTWADRDEVERVTWAVPGVRNVDCHVEVAPAGERHEPAAAGHVR